MTLEKEGDGERERGKHKSRSIWLVMRLEIVAPVVVEVVEALFSQSQRRPG